MTLLRAKNYMRRETSTDVLPIIQKDAIDQSQSSIPKRHPKINIQLIKCTDVYKMAIMRQQCL